MSVARGMSFMVAGTLVAATMNVCARFAYEELHPLEVAFFRCFVGLIAILPVCLSQGTKIFRTQRLGLLGFRALLQVGAMLLFFTGLGMAPLATVVALQFTTPLFGTILAVLLLGEVIRMRRVAAIVAGFIGTLIIIRPGFVELTTGPLVILASAFLWGATMAVIKRLGRTDSTLTQTFYASLFMAPIAFIAAWPFWRMPTGTTWFWLLGVGLCATAHNMCVTQAFREAELTAVAPLDFTKLLWISIYAALIFGEMPDPWTWLGAIIIFGSTTYMAFRERAAEGRG